MDDEIRRLSPRAGAASRRDRLRRAGLAAGALAVLAAAALLSAGPLARRIAGQRAAALGLQIAIRDTSLGWGLVRLRGVTVSAAELPGVSVALGVVEVVPSLTGSLGRLAVHGGAVRLSGSAEELEEGANAWRAAHGGEERRPWGASKKATPLSIDGVDLVWTGGAPGGAGEHLWGVRYERRADGHETLGADLLRVAIGGVGLELSHGVVELGREGGHRVVERVAAQGVAASLTWDAVRSATANAASPATANAASPATANAASPASPGAGAAAPDGVDPDATRRGARLRAAAGRVGTTLATLLRPSTRLALSGARLALHHDEQTLNVGPAELVVSRDADRVQLQVTSGAAEAAAPLRLELAIPVASGPVEVGLEGGPVSLAALGIKEHDMGLEAVDRAEVEVSGHATLSETGEALTLSGKARALDLSIFHPKLAAEPVRGIRVSLSGRADVKLDGSLLRVDDLEVGVGKVKLRTSGVLERSEGHARGKLHADIPLAACADMLASVPPALAPLLGGMSVTGTFAFAGDVDFDTRRPGDTRVDWDAASDCRVEKVPAALSPEKFSHPWVRTVLGPDGVPTTIESGPGTATWTPLFDITPYMATAVVVCEDASFWVHDGFNQKSIQSSIRDDLRAGKFVRGGSTVSMQLAKNLYLGREKTLSRKLQEAVLTLLLEQVLTKEQILELYLNVIEFAPGLYGVGPAAKHYFDAAPKDLSLAQAFYLISLLPNPKAHHFTADGTLTPTWAEYLRHLMDVAHKIHRIDDRELAAGLAETVRFGVSAAEAGGGSEVVEGSASPGVLELAPRDPSVDAEGP